MIHCNVFYRVSLQEIHLTVIAGEAGLIVWEQLFSVTSDYVIKRNKCLFWSVQTQPEHHDRLPTTSQYLPAST